MIFKRARTIETTELGRAWYSIRWLEQVASTPGRDSPGYHTEESCTQYNVLKIVRHLFRWTPSAALGDDYEHKVNNGVLGIQKSGEVGQMVYMTVSPLALLWLWLWLWLWRWRCVSLLQHTELDRPISTTHSIRPASHSISTGSVFACGLACLLCVSSYMYVCTYLFTACLCCCCCGYTVCHAATW